MKEKIREFIEPTSKEKQELWEKAVFVFDTNVLLNLYRYSAKTRNSLLAAFENFKERVWIPYQVAYEYMNKRCEVIIETINRYDRFTKEIDNFTQKAIEILRLTANDDEILDLKKYLSKWIDGNKDTNLLVTNVDNDEILDKILKIFDGRVGEIIGDVELNEIKEEGKIRYEKSIPPGYKDNKKKNGQADDNNAYGDLIIWKQILKYAKENTTGIIYVTHDQKEDWWNIINGKTIGPRIELRKEFIEETGQEFHMYSMSSFISTYNRLNENPIDKSAVDEVIGFERNGKNRGNILHDNKDLSLSEEIVRREETLDKIKNRILRRERMMKNIENKYQKKGIDMPENVRIQYDNTKEKLQELQEIYKKKLNEVEVLKKTKS